MDAKYNKLLANVEKDFFEIRNLSAQQKKIIFLKIKKEILVKKSSLVKLIMVEVKLTELDAEREVLRAASTFALAAKHADFTVENIIRGRSKTIVEKRVARGPLFAITPFSSPLSSPAHKIAMGLLVGTSVLFKPSPFAGRTGWALFQIVRQATKGKFVYFCDQSTTKTLQAIVADERIGIISFTGGYETGKKIISIGGVKKYHMELSGGNSIAVFSPDFKNYNDRLADKFVGGIIAKNGQRCVSIKHILISNNGKKFIDQIQAKLCLLKKEIQANFSAGMRNILGPLITVDYAQAAEMKIKKILKIVPEFIALLPAQRQNDFLFPVMHTTENVGGDVLKKILSLDLSGPVLFVHYYKNNTEYKKMLTALQNDYIRSGLQLSFFTNNVRTLNSICRDIIWGGIIINDLPTFRDDTMSFGGFGKAGLGKEGFFETYFAYTDPQTMVRGQC